MVMNPVADRLREVRRRLGLATRAQMAEKLGIPASTYNAYESESGPPKIEWLIELVRLGIDANWLLLGEGQPLRAPGSGTNTGPETVDELLLAAMISVVERDGRQSRGRDPLEKARLVVRLYNDVVQRARTGFSSENTGDFEISEAD